MKTLIKVIGTGSAGCNALGALTGKNLPIESIAIHTDVQSLSGIDCDNKIQLGEQVTRGLGTAGDVAIGKKIAQGQADILKGCVDKADLVFVIVGMGGGIGTTVAPKIIQFAAEAGATVICFAIMPFSFEGRKRLEQAHEGLKKLQLNSCKVVVLNNDILMQQMGEKKTALEAFNLANNWVSEAIASVCFILTQDGIINLDFATLRETFSGKFSKVLFGLGKAEGENYISDALNAFMNCPLLEVPRDRLVVDKLLISLIGGVDFSLNEANEILEKIKKKLGAKADIIIGVVLDENLKSSLSICAIGSVVPGRPSVASAANQDLSVNTGKNKLTDTEAIDIDRYQGEFAFGQDDDQRGYFGATEKTLYNGEDLDIPTYMRRGIKIAL